MSTAGFLPRWGLPAIGRRFVAPIVVAVLVVGAVLLSPGRAVADGSPAARIVDSVVAAWAETGVPGTLAVAVARQETPLDGDVSIRALEHYGLGMTRAAADNGTAAGRPFPTASLVKLFIAEDLLHRARTGRLDLAPADYAQVQTMIRRSDDPAASALWVRFDGPQMVRDVAARYGLTGTAPPDDPSQWGETTTTARDLARFLARLPVVAHRWDASALLFWMRSATPRGSDGFDQQFGLFGGVPGRPAVKQGWMCCVGGQRHLHSVGVVGDRVVVLLSEVPRSIGDGTVRVALSAAAQALPVSPRP